MKVQGGRMVPAGGRMAQREQQAGGDLNSLRLANSELTSAVNGIGNAIRISQRSGNARLRALASKMNQAAVLLQNIKSDIAEIDGLVAFE